MASSMHYDISSIFLLLGHRLQPKLGGGATYPSKSSARLLSLEFLPCPFFFSFLLNNARSYLLEKNKIILFPFK